LANWVLSVQAALSTQFAKIYEDTEGLSKEARRKRLDKEQERWRMALAGAKTQAQLRAALADLWSRAGHNKVLKESWPEVIVLLKPSRWQEARDLSLIALASYKGKGAPTHDDALEEPSSDYEQEPA
jgi:CRISPR-associated protein Cas8a1/Csx13